MDAFFAPICVITIVCLLVECLALSLHELNVALSCRFVILLLLYLAYVLKRDLVARGLRKHSRKLLHFHSYVIFISSTVGTLFHTILLCFLPFRLYCLCIVASSLPVALDEYDEIEWLREREVFQDAVETRTSLYRMLLNTLRAHSTVVDASIV